MRPWVAACIVIGISAAAPAATLEQLSFGELVDQASAIVRGRVTGTYTTAKGSLIYTHYRVLVSECWKGSISGQADLVVPGGALGGIRQSFPGAPSLSAGSEYVLFLWKSRSGLTHIIGLTQGLFDIRTDAKGNALALRAVSGETMLDRTTGRPVAEEPLSMTLAELRSKVAQAVKGAAR